MSSELAEDSSVRRAEEAGAAKLWSVYVDEADRYDRSLVASWKSDMEAMLIFAGLFSASLTAFLIESYKTLVQDPGDATVELLQQILIVSSNNSTSAPFIPQPFTPATSSLVCNALWFISLGLSLACALVATLLEQWARDFLHRANMRSSPVVRARVYSYLYYGLRRYKMHAVVEIIPSLLHAALLFFFCGLVVFLLPVNKIIAALVAGILGLVLGFYTFMTILPLIQFDSPYRTPFSNAIWGLSRFCALLFYQPTRSASPATSPATLVDNMIVRAISPSVGRRERDVSALIWTVSSLSDDTEPQNFIETIPDAMWGSSEQHHGNVALMTRLCASEEVNLPYRIAELWRSRNDGLLTSDAIEKRDAACLKAFWALCNISAPHPTTPFILPPILEHIPLYPDSPHSPYSNVISSPFYISMKTMANWSGIGWLQMYLQQHASRWAGSAYSDPVRRYLFRSFLFSSSEIRAAMLTLKLSITNSKQFDMVSRELCTSVSHRLFFDYLQTATTCGLLPYRWQETLDTIYLNDLRSTISENALRELESTIDTVFSKVRRVPRLWEQAAAQTVMRVLCGLWRPQKAREIPMGIIAYLKYLGKDASRNSQVSLLFAGLYRHLWRCFPSTIALYSIESSAASANSHHSETALHDMLAVLWMSIDLTMESTGTARLPPPSEDESNAVIEALAICASPLALAVMLVVKAVLLWGQTNTAIPFALVRKRLFELNHLHSTDLGGKLEDVVIILSYLFEQRTVIAVTDVLRVINALRSLTFLKPYDRNDDLIVHDLHQTRFAHGLMKISHLPTQQWHLVVRRVFESPVFDAPEGLERFHWITEPAAQENLRIVQRQMAKFRDVEQFAIEL